MNAVVADRTLGDLVTEDPGRTRVLERFGLDYCCGGQRTLHQACTEAGVDPTDVTAALATAPVQPQADWVRLGLTELIEHVVSTHHGYLWAEMPRLTALVEKVEGVHRGRHPELTHLREVYDELVADLTPHLLKEERVLFPAVAGMAASSAMPALPFGTMANPIRMMLAEHDAAGELLVRMREITGGYAMPSDGCASYQAMLSGMEQLEADLHEHIHKENNVLFPRVLAAEEERRAAQPSL